MAVRAFPISNGKTSFVGLETEDIEELGERFLDAETLDQLREWAEEKRKGRAS